MDTLARGTLYTMVPDGTWEDQGHGFVTVEKMEDSPGMGLYFTDDEFNEELCLHRIGRKDIYRKHEDTITWRDPFFGYNQRFSFEETDGCSNIWSRICQVRMSSEHTETLSDSSNTDESSGEGDVNMEVLHAVELSALPSILKTVTEYRFSEPLTLIEIVTEEQGFIKKLMELFRTCEEGKNVNALYMIFRIVKQIILINAREIFHLLFGDKWAMDILGCLEYNPKVATVVRHRDFTKNHVVFEEAIPIKDPLTLSKMHLSYRLSYLKEVIMRTELDTDRIQPIDNIIHENNAKVISMLKDDDRFLQELLARLRSSATSVESKRNLVRFLHELCQLIKSSDTTSELPLFRDLMNEGLFDIIAEVLQSPERTLVQTGADIITHYLHRDQILLIKNYLQKPKGHPLLGLLVKGFITDAGDGIHCQFLQMLYTLLDPVPSPEQSKQMRVFIDKLEDFFCGEIPLIRIYRGQIGAQCSCCRAVSHILISVNMVKGSAKINRQGKTMIDIFCEKHLSELIDVITSCPLEGAAQSVVTKSVQNNVKPEILLNICELICLCVQHNPVIMCYFLCNNAIHRVLSLTRRRETYLVAASIRFMRTILSRQDSILTAHIIKNNLLQPIVVAFVTNGNRYNLLHSATLELFEYFCKENMSSLVTYLVDTFWGELVQFEHLSSIRMLRSNYDEYHDDGGESKMLVSNMEEISPSKDRSRSEGSLCAAPTTNLPKISDGEEEMLEKFTTEEQ